jgi:hypothetical protein
MTTTMLPPSARDFQIYQFLLLDGASTRQAAADFSLSQTRIRQIVLRVTHWLAENLPKPTEAEDAAYIRLAQHIAADRLQLLYGEAMHGWRATHQAKYAGIILRLTLALGKMPVTSGTLDALIADALEGPLPDDDGVLASGGRQPTEADMDSESNAGIPVIERISTAADSMERAIKAPVPDSSFSLHPLSLAPPPPGDCSPVTAPQPSSLINNAPPVAVTATHEMASDQLSAAKSVARRAFFSPAHPREGEAPAEPSAAISELKITPQTLGFTTKKQLSRRDRRRLRRLAATK